MNAYEALDRMLTDDVWQTKNKITVRDFNEAFSIDVRVIQRTSTFVRVSLVVPGLSATLDADICFVMTDAPLFLAWLGQRGFQETIDAVLVAHAIRDDAATDTKQIAIAANDLWNGQTGRRRV